MTLLRAGRRCRRANAVFSCTVKILSSYVFPIFFFIILFPPPLPFSPSTASSTVFPKAGNILSVRWDGRELHGLGYWLLAYFFFFFFFLFMRTNDGPKAFFKYVHARPDRRVLDYFSTTEPGDRPVFNKKLMAVYGGIRIQGRMSTELLIAFPSSYSVDREFRAVTNLLGRKKIIQRLRITELNNAPRKN